MTEIIVGTIKIVPGVIRKISNTKCQSSLSYLSCFKSQNKRFIVVEVKLYATLIKLVFQKFFSSC